MTSQSKKRPKPDAASTANTKRQKTAASMRVAKASNINIFQLSAIMDEGFNDYPKDLREAMQSRHSRLVSTLVSYFSAGETFTPLYEYRITKRQFSLPKDETNDYRFTRPTKYPAVSLANQVVLDAFLDKTPSSHKKFTQLKVGDGESPMANPAFAQLHSVRSGEMGWGVDRFGCLSLHVTNMKDGCLKHEAMWVERVGLSEVKVEKVEKVEKAEDDECCVVSWRKCDEKK